MCGFISVVTRVKHGVDEAKLRHAASTIAHRGPDDDGLLVFPQVGMGFRRLAIQDLSRDGHQPMEDSTGELSIVFNGEIFNFVELRDELSAMGATFRSTSDTEVLLAAYRAWGPECTERLNGMWAFVIYDRPANRVFASRDRFGIKPLFVRTLPAGIVFASEIKAILAYTGEPAAANAEAVRAHLLEDRLDEGDVTFYDGILRFPAASNAVLDLDRPKMDYRKYWRLPGDPMSSGDADPSAYEELFKDSVSIRLRSDVPVGVTLSGGMDSTSIVSCIAQLKSHARNATPTMAFCFDSPEFDESRYLADTIRHTGVSPHFLSVTAEGLWDDIEPALIAHDEPMHSMTALVGFNLMKLARSNGVPVVLGGQGADETLAGYPNFFRDYWLQLARQLELVKLWKEADSYSEGHEVSREQLIMESMLAAIKSTLNRFALYRFMSERRNSSYPNEHWFQSDFVGEKKPGWQRPPDNLHDSLRRSVEIAPLPIYLRVEDRNSMAHSVEARLPFMDYRLVEYAFRASPGWKLRGPWNKFILREAMRGTIPRSVSDRIDKFGFPTPIDSWFRKELKPVVMDFLDSRQFKDHNVFNPSSVRRDIEAHMRGDVSIGNRIFKLLQFMEWERVCLAHRA